MIEKYKNDSDLLRNDLISGFISMIEKPRFDSIDIIKKEIDANKIEGDIIECGVWKGGMAIYLAYQFPNKTIWVSDSFEGFQPLDIATYEYANERHDEKFDEEHGHPFSIKISLEDVQANFKTFGADGDNIKYLKGWVKDTLKPETFTAEKIALLRVDVDAYSATLEVLEACYDKVEVGGYIVFDDSVLVECQAAIREFKAKRSLAFDLIYPSGRVGNDLDENGGYFKKV